jgi:sugar O-acyltransferase (sialic acid O-acetyltransferase NeuD family)
MMNDVAIYGAGGFGRELAWLAQSTANHNVVCFIDDDPNVNGAILNGLDVLSCINAKQKYPGAKIVSGIGTPRARVMTMQKAQDAGFMFATIIHPRVEISKWVEIGEGTVICAGNILTTNIVVGKHVQINLDCTIGHDVIIDDYATLSPGVHVSGCVHIGKQVYIGTGAVIVNGTKEHPVKIGDDAVIGAGACVTANIPPGQTWAGVPARSIK